ncbi:MAG: PqqD family peptide modification chaperone [Reyranellaceae bacterium]
MSIDDQTVIERAAAPPELNVTEDEIVLLDIDGSQYYTVTGAVGVRIWQMLAIPRSPASLVDRLLEEFDVDRRRCEEETRIFLHELIAKGLVRQVKRTEAAGK